MAFGGIGSKRIAGITIEIGADTTKLNSALKSFDKQLAKSKDSLKDIDNLLKLKPGNVTLLAQKQKELQKSISATKERLTELKKVQKDSVSPDEWDAIQREIIETENNLKGLEKEYRNFGSVAAQQVIAAGEKMQEVGSKIGEVGKGLSQKVTAPIVAGFGAALKVTADFDAQMSKVAAISGATGEDFDKLRAKAREMGAETKFSATEAGQAFEYMAMAGWKTDDMLDGIAGVMNLAAASGEDLGTTSDILTDALTAFGKTAADAGDFADVLAQASSNANTNVGLMGETFKYVAPVAGALGYNYRDVGVAIGLMANSGIKASQAGTALRGLFTRLAKPTKQSAEAMERLGISMTNADGSMKPLSQLMGELRERFSGLTEAEKAQYAAMLAGQNGMSGMLAIVNTSDKDFNDLTNAIANSDGAAQRMADRMNDNLAGQLTILKSQLEELAISIGDVLTPYARKLVGVVQKVTDRFNKLSPRAKKVAVLIGSVAAAIGPLLVGVGGFVSLAGKGVTAFGCVMKFLPAIKGGLTAIAGVLSGPVGIVAGVAAVIAIVLKATGAWDRIKASLIDAWPKIKQSAVDAWDGIKTKYGEFKAYLQKTLIEPLKALYDSSVKPVFDRIAEAFEPVKKSAEATWNVIKGIFNGWNSFGDLKILLGDLWENLKAFGAKLGTILSETDWAAIGSQAWELVKSAFAPAAEWLKGVFESGMELVKGIDWAAVGNAVWDGVKAVGGWLGNLFSNAWSYITTSIDWAAVGTAIWEGFRSVGVWLTNRFSDALEAIKNIDWATVGSTIKTKIGDLGNWLKGRFEAAKTAIEQIDWPTVGSKIKAKIGDLGEWLKGRFQAAKNGIVNIDWKGIGSRILTKIKNGLSELKDWFASLFDLSNVHIPTPHFSVTGWSGPFNAIPQVGVQWYRQAYDNPIMFTRPTVVNTPYGPKGFGDGDGGEVVLSAAKLRELAGGGGTVNNSITINQLPGESSEQLAERVQRVLVRWDRQRRAVYNT